MKKRKSKIRIDLLGMVIKDNHSSFFVPLSWLGPLPRVLLQPGWQGDFYLGEAYVTRY